MQLLENSPGGSFTPREMVPAQLRELQKGVSTPRGACRAPKEEPLLQLRISTFTIKLPDVFPEQLRGKPLKSFGKGRSSKITYSTVLVLVLVLIVLLNLNL